MDSTEKLHRFIVDGVIAAAGGEMPLPTDEAHHAANVLRLRAGEMVELFDGGGASAIAKIQSVRKGQVVVVVERAREASARPGPVVHLGFAVPKGKRLDWLLEKATELGAASLQPVIFERSVAGGDELSDNARRRWRGHCVSAAKQCGLVFLPAIEPPVELAAFAARAKAGLGLVGDLTDDCLSMPAAMARRHDRQGVFLLVGPEGGLTDAERRQLVDSGFASVRLGHTILRVETAAVALLAAVTAVCET